MRRETPFYTVFDTLGDRANNLPGDEKLSDRQATTPITATSSLTTRPNFLIIGAAKSGTTALWHYFRQHPQIYMSPRKHTRFFAYEVEDPGFRGPGCENPSLHYTMPYAVADIRAYHALFAGATSETAIGEASHSYLYGPRAAERIQEYAPEMKLVAVLRNPAERAFSHYRQLIRDGREPLDDFVRALEEEDARICDQWWPDFHYVQVGLYHAQLERYFERFQRDQIKVYLYEDLNSDPSDVLRDVFRFLDIDEGFVPEATVRYNASGIPKNEALHLLLQKLRRIRPVVERFVPQKQYGRLLRIGSNLHNRNLASPQLSPQVRKRVTNEYFREDILKLQDLIQRDLSAWLE
jgi:hypothetical protein